MLVCKSGNAYVGKQFGEGGVSGGWHKRKQNSFTEII